MQFRDKVLVCIECKKEFLFSAGSQQFFRERGLHNEPKRCKECKGKQAPYAFNPSSGEERIRYTVNCSQCGKEAVVPFVPRQGRPVLCRDCFHTKRSAM